MMKYKEKQMQLRIILVEDDPLQAEWIAEEVIWKEFPSAEIKYFDSEYSFFVAESVIQGWHPTHALLDMLVRYYSIKDLTTKNDEVDPPPHKKPEEAGIRCRDQLRHIEPSCSSMIITVLDVIDENERIQKGSSDFGLKVTQFLKRRVFRN
jgi:hypothetical protein